MSTEVIERLLREVAREWNARAIERDPPYTYTAAAFPVLPDDEIVILIARGEATRDVRLFVELTLGGRVNEAPIETPQRGLNPPASLRHAD